MNQSDSQELLAQYVRNGSERAFRELVVRYLNLVYSTAKRSVNGDTHKAEDVAQTVFLDLARLASKLSKDTMLGGWLHRHTCYVAATLMRGERRRMARERQAVEMNILNDRDDPGLAHLAPLLDAAINELDDEDRKAILLRFYEKLDLRSIGLALGSSENAAQKRVTRALDQLHFILTQQGVTISAAALTALLAAEAVTATPAGLAASIVGTAIAGAAAGAGLSVTLVKLSALTKLKLGIAAAVVVDSLATPLWLEHQARLNLDGENRLLRQQLGQKPQLPNQIQLTSVPADTANLTATPTRRAPLRAAMSQSQSLDSGRTELGSSVAPGLATVAVPAAPLLYGANHPFASFYSRSGSTMRMEGKSNIHDWQAESSLIGGFLDVGPGFPVEQGQKAKAGPVEAHAETFVMVPSLKSVDSNGRPYSERMDELLHDALKAREHPKITYYLTQLTLTQPAKSRDLPNLFDAEGDLVVAGVTNSLTMPVSVMPMRDKKLKISGSTTISMKDFQIDPSALTMGTGLLQVDDEVKLSFVWLVSQRSQGSSSATLNAKER